MSGRTSVFWGCLPITRPCESRGRVTLESTNHESIAPICGGNVGIDLLALVVGQFVDEARTGKAATARRDMGPAMNLLNGGVLAPLRKPNLKAITVDSAKARPAMETRSHSIFFGYPAALTV
jgi:hypothetical protein